MKKKLMLLSLLAFITFNSIAQKQKPALAEADKKISVSSFDRLIIDGSFKVTLVENDEPTLQVKGSAGFMKALKVLQNQKELLIKSHYTVDTEEFNHITINVKNLKTLVVLQEANINTEGILQSANLNIMLDAECVVKVMNQGATKVESSDDFFLEISGNLPQSL